MKSLRVHQWEWFGYVLTSAISKFLKGIYDYSNLVDLSQVFGLGSCQCPTKSSGMVDGSLRSLYMVGPTLMESYIICIKDLTVGPTSGPYFNFIDDTNPLVLNFHVIWDRPKFDHII